MKTHLGPDCFLVSHGGVSSEALTAALDLTYSKVPVGPKPRPFKGAFVHAPFPPPTGPARGIYLYGDLFKSLISQLNRHPDNAKKMKNDENYPEIMSYEDLFSATEPDPFGIAGQFHTFCRTQTDYPMMFLNRVGLQKNIKAVAAFAGADPNLEWVDKERSSKWRDLDSAHQNDLRSLYGALHTEMRNLPAIMIRYPLADLAERDGLKGKSLKRIHSLTDQEIAAVAAFRELDVNTSLEGITPRVKHISRLRDGQFTANVRLDRLNEKGLVASTTGHVILYRMLNGQFLAGSAKRVRQKEADAFTASPGGQMFVGLEDHRSFSWRQESYLICNGPIAKGERKMMMYDVTRDDCKAIEVEGIQINNVEKNWTPFVHKDELYIIYSMNPLVVLKSVDRSVFKFRLVSCDTPEHKVRSDYPWGSTPLVPWIPPYQVGFAHSRDPWRAVPVVFNAETMRICYGSPIKLKKPAAAKAWRGKDVQFPYHLDLEDGNPRLWVEYEDRHSAVVHFDFEDMCKEWSRLMGRLEKT
jgi:hypothetical protein